MNARTLRALSLTAAVAVATQPGVSGAPPQSPVPPPYQLHGLNFSPYIDGQSPAQQIDVSEVQIQQRLAVVAPHTQWIRTFGMTHGLEETPRLAKNLGKQVAAGAWIGRESNPAEIAENNLQVQNLIAAALAGYVDIAIVGSEVLRRGDVSKARLIQLIGQVRQALPSSIPVTTADIYPVFLQSTNADLLAAIDVVLPNIYAYWESVPIADAVCATAHAYARVVQVAGSKPVIISEAGWPSDGPAAGPAVASPSNAALFFLGFESWARPANVPYFYFSAFDEKWKIQDEGAAGAHWGTWFSNGVLKPAREAVLNGQTQPPPSCLPGGAGTPMLELTYVPTIGSPANKPLEGRALHVTTWENKVALYIKVNGFWWTKPTFAAPTVPLNFNGTWSAPFVTGGSDAQATEIAAFLVPNGYTPPQLDDSPLTASLPDELFIDALAYAQTTRAASSIEGQVVTSGSLAVPGVTVTLSDGNTATTTTSAAGRYSFAALPNPSATTVTPIMAGYVFAPASITLPAVASPQGANFIAWPTTSVVRNGTFDEGLWSWLTFATPDMTYVSATVSGGVLEFSRAPAPPGTTNQAVVFQQTGLMLESGAPILVAFDLGNTSAARKRVTVLVHDADFLDLSVCTFWLAPNTPLDTYSVRLRTTKPWANATISFYAATANAPGDFGKYRVDNVTLRYDPTGSAAETVCVDPAAPAPGAGGPGPDLVINGGFDGVTSAPWLTFGTITSQIAAGVLQFIRPDATPPAGVVFQGTGQPVSARAILTSTFQLGNSSVVRKRVTVLLHDGDFGDLSACTFWLPAGQPVSTYTMRTYATKAWANATLSIYSATIGPEMWTRVDNVTMRQTPATLVEGTECTEP